jgi:hypothetical protein
MDVIEDEGNKKLSLQEKIIISSKIRDLDNLGIAVVNNHFFNLL